jgi:transposase
VEESPSNGDTHWSTPVDGQSHGDVAVGDLTDLAGVWAQSASGADLETVHRSAIIDKVRDIVGSTSIRRLMRWSSRWTRSPSPGPVRADPAGHGYDPARMTHTYTRHSTTSLFAALEISSGSVIAQHYRRHRHQQFLRFLKTIDDAVHAELDLHLICDDYATHKIPAIHQWLLHHPRFHLHFTPTRASWLNLVERWFAELTNRTLRRSAHRSVTELEADIRAGINEWNADPKPFVWAKTADEILDNLASYCQRINASGH